MLVVAINSHYSLCSGSRLPSSELPFIYRAEKSPSATQRHWTEPSNTLRTVCVDVAHAITIYCTMQNELSILLHYFSIIWKQDKKKNYRICSRGAQSATDFHTFFFSFISFCVNRVCSIHSLFPQAHLNGNFSRTISWAIATCSASYKICVRSKSAAALIPGVISDAWRMVKWVYGNFCRTERNVNKIFAQVFQTHFTTRAMRSCREAYIAICMLVVAKVYAQWT